ncbi:AraC family transcriptional regulator [Leptospira kmetyi]|nr:helix-turn-helix domain-containing protein [Leptospira kmetyi]EQA55138.1 DNA-binding helix-turn-helix protein [Leptospira kmetyi serovar Malaysia str. Bejo-Iso9]PJZ40116.1 AraC family transcriptional regulator [Leptospira kmetyi]TGK19530.1 AraC family transcriptional regulator [Leptospira kmetyi]TGK26471.1 AraC family transcriptional regulator [Leptospira kmetyi]TGL70259.1 AraC family transcriptional regulator [Leptospira kmetyi]
MSVEIYFASAIQYVVLGSIYYYKRKRPFHRKQALILILIGFNLFIFSSQSQITRNSLLFAGSFLYSFFTIAGTIIIYTVCKESFEFTEKKNSAVSLQTEFKRELFLTAIVSLVSSTMIVSVWHNSEPKTLPNLFATVSGVSIAILSLYCLYVQFFIKSYYVKKGLKLIYLLIALMLVEKLNLIIPESFSDSATKISGIVYVISPIFLFSNLILFPSPKQISSNRIDLSPSDSLQRRSSTEYVVTNLDHGMIMRKLYDLFVKEKIFLDEDLRLPSVAEEMGLSVHQLSAFINRYLRTNFNTFVNYYRIQEAMSLLKEEPSRSVISIGMAVGFNALSTFQRFFVYATKMTPSKYREETQKGNRIEYNPIFQPIESEIRRFEERYFEEPSISIVSEHSKI